MNTPESLLSLKAQALLHHGYVQVPHVGILNNQIKNVMNNWKLFCAQPLEHKNKFVFDVDGYENKSTAKGDFEDKENMHISLSYEPDIVGTNVDSELIYSVKKLIKDSVPVVLDIAKIYKEHSDFMLVELFSECIDMWSARLLHYPSQEVEFLAKSHIDLGISIHFGEDAPGFEVLHNGVWQPVQPMHEHLLTYAGATGQYYTNSKIDALCHRVVTTPETRSKGRSSLVLFIDPGSFMYNKKAYGPTQKRFPAGENYGVPFDEFQKFFKRKN